MIDCKKLAIEEYRESEHLHGIAKGDCIELPYKNTHAWIFKDPLLFDEPIPYKHPNGAVIWVSLGYFPT